MCPRAPRPRPVYRHSRCVECGRPGACGTQLMITAAQCAFSGTVARTRRARAVHEGRSVELDGLMRGRPRPPARRAAALGSSRPRGASIARRGARAGATIDTVQCVTIDKSLSTQQISLHTLLHTTTALHQPQPVVRERETPAATGVLVQYCIPRMCRTRIPLGVQMSSLEL